MTLNFIDFNMDQKKGRNLRAMTHNIYLFFFNRNPENISILEMSIGIGVYCIFIVGNSLCYTEK